MQQYGCYPDCMFFIFVGDVFSIANYSVNVWRSYQSIGFFPTGILVSSGGGGAGEISNIVKMQTGQSGVDEGLVESAVAVAIRCVSTK